MSVEDKDLRNCLKVDVSASVINNPNEIQEYCEKHEMNLVAYLYQIKSDSWKLFYN